MEHPKFSVLEKQFDSDALYHLALVMLSGLQPICQHTVFFHLCTEVCCKKKECWFFVQSHCEIQVSHNFGLPWCNKVTIFVSSSSPEILQFTIWGLRIRTKYCSKSTNKKYNWLCFEMAPFKDAVYCTPRPHTERQTVRSLWVLLEQDQVGSAVAAEKISKEQIY